MEIPKTIVELAKCTALDSTEYEYTWTQKDSMMLYATPDGKKLVLILKSIQKPNVKWSFSGKTKGIGKGKSLFSRFTGFKSDKMKGKKIPEPKLKRCGTAISITYDSDKWDGEMRRYIHEFDGKPSLYCDNPGKPTMMVLSSGKLRVTSLGIEG